MKKTQLQALLDHAISDSPDKTAIHFKTHSYSYLELHHLSKKLAAGLQNNGVNKGDRVAIFLPNCPEAVMLFLACYMLGAIAVPLNYRYLSEEARYVIERTGAKIIVFHSDKKEIINKLQDLFSSQNIYHLNPASIIHNNPQNSLLNNDIISFS